MSKLSFRARALDAGRPMCVWLAEELPDLQDYSSISRAVPPMPTGMDKDEECEHHLQRAICAGLIIPTPEVCLLDDEEAYDRLYPANYHMPRQLIHVQPLGLDTDLPDYDMDSEDEKWLKKQQAAASPRKCDLTELKFEELMERLERNSGQRVVTLREARALMGRNSTLADHLLAAVYDYWLNKRLATQQPLLLTVRTEPRPGAPAANPYLAFRRRTEKMQTRKNRKNDESSYEKMVKLRRELSRVVTLLEMIKKRERAKKELVRITSTIVDKQIIGRDFSGHLLAEAAASRSLSIPSLVSSYTNSHHHRSAMDAAARQRDKRQQYRKRKHRHHSSSNQQLPIHHNVASGSSSSSEGDTPEVAQAPDLSGPFAFRRKAGCHYHMPTASFGPSSQQPWRTGGSKENTFPGDSKDYTRYSLTSINYPSRRCIGMARRRLGRGGRVILDRLPTSACMDRLWESMDYKITDCHELNSSLSQNTNFNSNSDSVNKYDNDVEMQNSGSESGSAQIKELLVRRGLRRYHSRANQIEEAVIKDIFKDCAHFRPKTPEIQEPSEAEAAEGEAHLTKTAPITVTVRTDKDLPSNIFKDTSPFTSSEFTLTDLYGDSLLPDSLDIPEVNKTSWNSVPNGPSKPSVDSPSDSPLPPKPPNFLSENSNATSESAVSFEDSTHGGTNGVTLDWRENKDHIGSSVFKVKSLVNADKVYLSSEAPPSPPAAAPAPPQKLFIAQQQQGHLVQVKAGTQVRQVLRGVVSRGDGLFVTQVPKNQQTLSKRADPLRRGISDQQILSGGTVQTIQVQSPQLGNQGQQMMVAVSDGMKLRLPNHELISLVHQQPNKPKEQVSPRRVAVQVATTDGSKQVKVVRALTAAQRSRLMGTQLAMSGPPRATVNLRDFSMVQVQRVYTTPETLETGVTQITETVTPSTPPVSGEMPGTPPKSTSNIAQSASTPTRKGTPSLPMEVT